MSRSSRLERVTKETSVVVELDLDGTGTARVSTGVPFFDHMLAQLAKHGLLDLAVAAEGDIEIDAHHTVEDTAITLGQALREALGDKAGISRFGDAVVPLDETLARAAVDVSGRPYLVHDEPDGMAPLIGTYDTTLTRHFFESLTASAGICLHLSADRAQPAPHRRGPVQGGGAGAARGGGAGPAGAGRAQHQGRPVTRPRAGGADAGRGSWCSTTVRGTSVRRSGRWCGRARTRT